MNKFAALMGYIRENMGETELGLNSMLAYIHQETASGSTVNTTKLVRKLCFGTGPTVNKKIAELEFRGLIDVSQSGLDLRANTITVTKQGEQYLLNSERQCLDVIAAAPDLLEALRCVVNDWVAPDGLPFEDGEMPALDSARAAIAKATGSQS